MSDDNIRNQVAMALWWHDWDHDECTKHDGFCCRSGDAHELEDYIAAWEHQAQAAINLAAPLLIKDFLEAFPGNMTVEEILYAMSLTREVGQ